MVRAGASVGLTYNPKEKTVVGSSPTVTTNQSLGRLKAQKKIIMRTYIKIAEAHIEAKKNKSFSNPIVKSNDEVINALKSGHTFDWLLYEIEKGYVSITSMILSTSFDHMTGAYAKAIKKGFRVLLKKYEVPENKNSISKQEINTNKCIPIEDTEECPAMNRIGPNI